MGRRRKDVGEDEEEEEGEEKRERRWRGRLPKSDVSNKETHKMYDDEPGVLKVYEGEDYVRIPMKALNSDFSCPVCLGIIKSAMVVTQCMHRFCEECISNSLRLGNKECPKCRAKCASKRHLRPDHAFDKLLLSVIKDVDKFEDEQLKLVKQVTASAKVTGNSALISEGIIKQSKNRGKRLTKHDIDSAALLPSSSSSSLPPLRATPSEKNKPTKKRERTTRAKSIESTPERVPFEPPPPKKVKKTPKEKKTPDPILDPVPDGGEKGPVCWTYYQHNKVKDSIIVQRPVPNASPLITIYLQRHPESKLPILERPWLTLPKSVQIDVLKNFVHKKHRINSPLTFFLRSPVSERTLDVVKDTTAPMYSLLKPYDGPYITLFYSDQRDTFARVIPTI